MTPAQLQPASFDAYSAGARDLALAHLALLRSMPLSLLPSYLVQIKRYDSLFPVEQQRLQFQLSALEQHSSWVQPFAAIRLAPELERLDWLHEPAAFVAALAASLWQTAQIDAYHKAGEDLFAAMPVVERPAIAQPPLVLAVFGRDATNRAYPLFSRLGAQGMALQHVADADALAVLAALLAQRAEAAPIPYGHWYIDGGTPMAQATDVAHIQQFAYPSLAPVTDVILHAMDRAVEEGTGPELLADRLRAMPPRELKLDAVTGDARLQDLFVSLLTAGSGTQLYSTSFIQAAAVELLRRAQPQTLLMRFAPRRRPASMNDMLQQHAQSPEVDPDGSLIDADMAIYYAWLAMQQSPGGDRARLLAYLEGQGRAFLAGPGIARGVESSSPLTMRQAVALLA